MRFFAPIALLLLMLSFLAGCTTTTATQGDTVTVDYTGLLADGTVFDTSIRDVAVAKTIPDPNRNYQPLVFQIGKGAVIPGFENALIGMHQGEQKTVTIPPEQAYGPFQEELVLKNLKKTIELKKDVIISQTNFKTVFRKEPSLQEILSPGKDPFQYKVIAINDANVTLQNLATVGQVVQFPDVMWKTTVTDIKDGTVFLMQDPKVGDQRAVQMQQGQQSAGRVIRVDETTYDVDLNHALAGKTLTFTVTLVDIKKA